MKSGKLPQDFLTQAKSIPIEQPVDMAQTDTPFPLEEHGSFLALSKAFTHAFRLYSYDGKGVVKKPGKSRSRPKQNK